MRRTLWLVLLVVGAIVSRDTFGQAASSAPAPLAGSVVEDRAAAKLLEAGQARYEAEELAKAVEIWQSVIERYPRSKTRFAAHMLLGDYFLNRDRSYDRARTHFEVAATDDNRDDQQRAEAALKVGMCYYHARNYSQCFVVMRELIEKFPNSPHVNQAYYHIGLGHFQLGQYSRAIAALEKVGTTLSGGGGEMEKLEAGKPLFLRIDDADLAVLEPGQAIDVRCEVTSGDVETVKCYGVGRNVRLVLGSIPTRLGRPATGDGELQVQGGDKVKVTYVDQQTAEQALNRPVVREVPVVGTAVSRIMDGAFGETIRGVVLGKDVNLQVADADADLTDAADTLTVAVEVLRPKTAEELDAERAKAAADADTTAIKVNPLRPVDRMEVKLVEAGLNASPEAGVHSGVFRGVASLEKADQAVAGDQVLQALPGDVVRVTYVDQQHRGDGVRQAEAQARCLEGNIGGVRVTRAEISDEELRIQTQLKIASALTNIGNRYKEFGLKENAQEKYKQALAVCEEVVQDARKVKGQVLEQTYVQLWQIYFEMDQFSMAGAMCYRLQREFPGSGFVDAAMLQLAQVAAKQGDFSRAIAAYARLRDVPTSRLRGEAQFGIAECYELMAKAATTPGAAAQQHERAFQEYKRVFDQFPNSGRVGEAVAKMAAYYYQQKDYARAVDTFENVLSNYPDAKFMDVILFNYGRCLYRMGRKAEAHRRFDQLVAEFPESPLAADARKISEAFAEAEAAAQGPAQAPSAEAPSQPNP